MAGTMTLQFGVGRIPSIRTGIALGAETVGVPVIVELLGHVPTDDLPDGHVAVGGQAVVTVDGYICQWYGMGYRLNRQNVGCSYDLDCGLDRKSVFRCLIADDETIHGIAASGGILLVVSLLLFGHFSGIGPACLAIFGLSVGVGDPHLVGKTGCGTCRTLYQNGFDRLNGASLRLGSLQDA